MPADEIDKMDENIRSRWVVIAISVVFGLGGCSHGPPPESLEQLEETLASKDVDRVRKAPGGSQLYRDTRRYRRRARVLYEDGDLDRAKHYAIIGQLSYRTAEARYRQFRAKERFEKFQDEARSLEKEARDLRFRLAALRNDVRTLEREYIGDLEAYQKALRDLPGEPDKSEIEEAIGEAEDYRNDVEQFEERYYDVAKFNHAAHYLDVASTIVEKNGPLDLAVRSASTGRFLFRELAEEANPAFRIEELEIRLRDEFGSKFVERVEENRVRFILSDVFVPTESNVREKGRGTVEALTGILSEYHPLEIDIEGFAHAPRNETRRLTVSQARAQKIQQQLVGTGFERRNIDVRGRGAAVARFEGSSALNERVELIVSDPR